MNKPKVRTKVEEKEKEVWNIIEKHAPNLSDEIGWGSMQVLCEEIVSKLYEEIVLELYE